MNTTLRIALSTFAATVFTPIILHALSRILPAPPSDTLEVDSLSHRYRSLELWSQLAAIVGVIGAVVFFILMRVGNTPWIVGLVFGWPVLVAVVFIATFTLPHGLSDWRDFWRFYELRYNITLRFVVPLYASLAVLGLVSTAVVLSR
ncbi:MAG TPA: hypothetical protein VEP30_12305 [Chthoniobacterales bacterium]|nr:hypothetical protein [Chthoniobacterales bacterium]